MRGAATEIYVPGLGLISSANVDRHLLGVIDRGKVRAIAPLLKAGADIYAGDGQAVSFATYRGQWSALDILFSHAFRAEAWQGKSMQDIMAATGRLNAVIETASGWGASVPPANIKEAKTLLMEHALPRFHEKRREQSRAFQPKPRPAQPRPL